MIFDLTTGPKSFRTAPQSVISGSSLFPAQFSPEAQAELNATLDQRAGAQRGKPRSRTPEMNPLGGRIFDMAFGWPMYRAPYKDSFRYVCGFYMQSHAGCCHHNHADGPNLVRFMLSCVQQRLFNADRLDRLERKLMEIAERELGADKRDNELAQHDANLRTIERQLETVSRNLALAASPAQLQAISIVFDDLQEQKRNLQSAMATSTKNYRGADAKSEVAAAMKVARDLAGLAGIDSNYTSAATLFHRLNIRLFLQFRDAQWGKRTIRRPAGGVVTFGNAAAPVRLYEGPTGRRELNAAIAGRKSDPVSAGSDALFTHSPRQEGDSSGNANRGDRI